MHRVAGEKYPAILIAVCQQEVLPPLAAIDHLVFHRHRDDFFELRFHRLIALDDGVQGEMARRILHDEE